MSKVEYFTMLYCWVFLLTILVYYMGRRFLSLRQRVAIRAHYPIVRALSIMLVAFSIRHGMTDLILPIILQSVNLEYTPSVYNNSIEAIVFYLAVTLIAVSYSGSVMQRKE